jgi:hypothetical protein
MLVITGSFSPRHVDAENWIIKKNRAKKIERRSDVIFTNKKFLLLWIATNVCSVTGKFS